MESNRIILSIYVICHNQIKILPRCIISILQQKISCPYEIIISDDRSTDGTWELIQDYQKQFPNLIRGFQINSDICAPTNNAERCGYNKACCYTRAKGKYIVGIDGDDFLLGDCVYQKQLELLENHPNCSMCMQNIWVLNDGDLIENGQRWKLGRKLTTGQIITAKEFINEPSLRVLNQGYMIRRNFNVDPIPLYGKHFDDTIITYHHLQFGNVVYLDHHDYVYVKYATSIDSSLQNDNRELIYNLLPIHHIIYIPRFAGLFFKNGLTGFIRLFKINAEKTMEIDNETKAYLSEFEGFIFKYFQNDKRSIYYKFRLCLIRIIVLSLKRWSIDSPLLYRLTYALMTNYREMTRIPKKHWCVN